MEYTCLQSWLPENDDSQSYYTTGVDGFRFLHNIAAILFGSSLILVPAGILYLAGFSKQLSFGVVAIFGGLFAFVMSLIEQPIGHAVVGVVAYIAVLATFLANVT